jgi:Ca2+-transporting ATPase
MRTLRAVQQELLMSPDAGLSTASVVQSRQRFGANRLTPLPREPLWRKFLDKFNEPIIKILLAAALVSMVIGIATGHGALDSLAIMIAVLLATGVAFLSEYKSDREFEILNAQKDSLRVKVIRDGAFHTLPLEEVVVGDSVVLETGDEIPADGRLTRATDLFVDQSLMTGESEPVHKQPRPVDEDAEGPEQPGCLYRGTQVVDGAGQMLVTEVGDATYLGQIARRLTVEDDEASGEGQPAETGDTEAKRVRRKLTVSKKLTPLQQKLQALADLISKVGYLAAAAIFLALLVRGVMVGEVGPAAGILGSGAALLRYFMYMVIVIVVAVPEGLPMSVTVSLALAMRKMTRANSLVRQLAACETVGSTTVICSDKTGTLTQNKMQVVRLCWDGSSAERGARNSERGTRSAEFFPLRAPGSEFRTPIDWIILNAAVNSTANLEQKDSELRPVGNSTEGALLLWLHECGIEYLKLRLQFDPLYQIHFSSERKRMTTVIRWGERCVVLVKGASEWLLEQSAEYLADDGTVRAWTPEARQVVQEQLRDSAARAMRTLAFGYAVLAPDTVADYDGLHAQRDALENGLVYVGLAAIRDPLREDVQEALAQCRRAGIDVKIVTGDNIETARAIGAEIGLLERGDALVLTSAEFNALDDDELKQRLPRLRILARARPLDKLRLVRLLQELDEVVAVTGDGTNDAPALKKADVGLAMGQAGTEVAKEASAIVLLDDSFATIVKAVHWGRSLYENIQRFLQFQLTINVSALAIAFLGPFFGVKPPFTILQLLWINVIMDTLAAIALCSEPPRPGLMRLPPKRRDENIVTRAMRWNIFTTAGFFVVAMLALLLVMEPPLCWFAGSGEPSSEFRELTIRQVSIFFTVYVFFQAWNEINCRSLVPEVSGLRGVLRNPVFLAIVAIIVLGQVLIVTFGGDIFKVEPLALGDWLAITAGTASVLLFAEIARRVRLIARQRNSPSVETTLLSDRAGSPLPPPGKRSKRRRPDERGERGRE